MSNNKIEVEALPLEGIICLNENLYQIPLYQRPYSWGQEQIEELIDDLFQAFDEKNEEDYFCGSIVLVKNKNGDGPFQQFDVIDGQQRLTTFVLMACVIRRSFLKNFEYAKIKKERIEEIINKSIEIEPPQTNAEPVERLTIQTLNTSNDGAELNAVIQRTKESNFTKKGKLTKNEKNPYWKGVDYVENALERKKKELLEGKKTELEEFIHWMYKKVTFVKIVCENEDSAIQIFNTLNDRGLELSSADIIKSRMMQKLDFDKDRETFHNGWERTKKKLEHEDEQIDDLFTVYLYYLNPVKSQKEALHKVILDKLEKLNYKPLDSIIEIEEFSNEFLDITNSNNTKSILCLNYFGHERYWQSILTTARYKDRDYYEDLEKILLAFYYQCWIADEHFTSLKKITFEIVKKVKDDNCSIDEIKKEINNLLIEKDIPNAFDSALNESWQDSKKAKAVLALLEYSYTDNKDMKNLTDIMLFREGKAKVEVEHILPQNPHEESDWKEIFSR